MTDDLAPRDEDAPRGAGERLFYRDDEEFNKALDAASESIRVAKGPDVVGNSIWWGLIAIQVLFYGLDWIFGWEVRDRIIPGVDMTKPVWVVIIAMVLAHHAWTRNRHSRILKSRLCFQCGASLLECATDDAGDGTCPSCGHAFNLGAYRRPSENRGSGFQGYIDQQHFDKTTYAAAEQIRRTRGSSLEGDIMGWCWLALGLSFGAALLGWDVLDWIPGAHGIWFVLMLLWSGFYTLRVKRLQPAIAERKLCMNCGYCLREAPTDADGEGRCPECAEVFVVRQYEKPAEA